MAINRYDVPAQDRYFNTYVDLPYEQIMGTVAARQAQLDRAQEAMLKTYEDTQNLEYIPNTQDEQYVRDYIGNVNNLVGKYYTQDMSDPIVAGQLRSEFNRITNRQHLKNIQMSKQAWDVNNKLKAQLTAEGLYDPILDEDPSKLSSFSTINDGVYNYVTSPYKNPGPVADTYFKDLKAGDLGNRGDYWYEGVDKKRIDEVVNAKWGSFADTSEGRQYVKKMAIQSGQDPNDPVVREKIAKEYLRDVGYSQWTWENRGGVLPETSRTSSGGNGKDNPTYQGLISYLPMESENINPDVKRSRQLFKEDQQRYEVLGNEITNIDDQLSKVSNDSDRIRLSAMKQDLVKERSMIEDIVKSSQEKYLPGYNKDKDNILNTYYNKLNKAGIDKSTADALLSLVTDQKDNQVRLGNTLQGANDIFSMNRMYKVLEYPFDVAKLDADKLLKWFDTASALGKSKGDNKFNNFINNVRENIAQSMKYNYNPIRDAIDVNNQISSLDKKLNRKIKSDYNENAYTYKQDKGIVMLGSGITDDITTNTTTIEGKLKVPETSLLLKQFKDAGAQGAEIKDVSYYNKGKDIMTDINDMRQYILNSNNVGLDLAAPSGKSDGTYSFVVTAKKDLGKGNIDTKKFKITLNDPERISTWRNALANDLYSKGRIVEGDRLANDQVEMAVKSQMGNKEIVVAPDQNNPRDIFKFIKNDNGSYTEVDYSTGKPTGDWNNIDLESVIQLLYSYRNRNNPIYRNR